MFEIQDVNELVGPLKLFSTYYIYACNIISNSR